MGLDHYRDRQSRIFARLSQWPDFWPPHPRRKPELTEGKRHFVANTPQSRIESEPEHMPGPAIHHTILCVDVEEFGHPRRTNPHQLIVRESMYRSLRQTFGAIGVSWGNCYREDRGDGVMMLIPPDVPKSLLVMPFLGRLTTALVAHNQASAWETRIRLRVVLHAGEVHRDGHGVTGTALNMAFRLLEATALKSALQRSPGALALITSQWFFQEVIRHDPASNSSHYREARVSTKETQTTGWIWLPHCPDPSHNDN